MAETMIDDETLRNYLAETLAPGMMARVERGLRDSAELRARLEAVRQDRADPALHTLGAIWRRSRLSCCTREQLGSYLLDVLDPELTRYIAFHLDVVECPICRANADDLRRKAEPAAPVADDRRRRIFHSSRHLLSGEV